MRRPHTGQYSIETLFTVLIEDLSDDIEIIPKCVPWTSKGFWNRLRMVLWAAFNQEKVNHVTGDIHFINLFLKNSILTIHDCEFIHRSKGLKKWLLELFWIKLPMIRARAVTTISESSRRDIVEISGCSPDKVRVIPNFVHPAFKPAPIKKRTERPILLQVGTKPNKNLERVIPAIEGLNVTLRVIGKMSREQWQLAKDKGIEIENHFDLSTLEMVQMYQTSFALIFMSIEEGFGLPVIEAQSCDVAVVTSNLSSLPEVAGKGALFADPYNIEDIRAAIIKVLNNPDIAKEVVQKGKENIKRYSLKETSKSYMSLYKEVALA